MTTKTTDVCNTMAINNGFTTITTENFAWTFSTFTTTMTTTARSFTSVTTVTSTELLSYSLVTTDSWCPAATTYTLTAPSLTNQNHAVGSGSRTYTFPTFTLSSVCSDLVWTYKAQLSGGSALPTYLTLSSSTRTFTLNTDLAGAGTLTVQIIAYINNRQSQTATFTWTLYTCP